MESACGRNRSSRTTKCHLLDLPAELRILILSQLLLNEGTISFPRFNKQARHHFQLKVYPEILRTCHQLHSEGCDILYGLNIFNEYVGRADYQLPYIRRDFQRKQLEERILSIEPSVRQGLELWLEGIGRRNLARLRDLRVQIIDSFRCLHKFGARLDISLNIEISMELRAPYRRSYAAKYMYGVPEHKRLDLEPDAEVESAMKLVRAKAEAGEELHIDDVMAVHRAATEVRPKLKGDMDTSSVPPEVLYELYNIETDADEWRAIMKSRGHVLGAQ